MINTYTHSDRLHKPMIYIYKHTVTGSHEPKTDTQTQCQAHTKPMINRVVTGSHQPMIKTVVTGSQ